MAQMINPIHAATDAGGEELKDTTLESALARRLMTVPGVDLVVALSFIATLESAERFRRSRDVRAFLVLTSKRH